MTRYSLKLIYLLTLLVLFTLKVNSQTTLYWKGGAGNWSDGTKWSLTSGGSSANIIPTINDTVYFDNNSFSGIGQTISLDINASCDRIIFTGVSFSPSIDFDGKSLTIATY